MKRKKKILIIILILILLIMVLAISLNLIEKEDITHVTGSSHVEYKPIYEEKEEKKVYPKYSYEFITQYKKVGNLNLNDLYSEVYKLKEKVEKISKKTKGLSVNDMEKYYDENKNELNLFKNKEQFIKFIDNIEFLKNESIKFSYAQFDIDTFENIVDDYVRCNLILEYNEGKDSINFSIRVAKKAGIEKYIFTSN